MSELTKKEAYETLRSYRWEGDAGEEALLVDCLRCLGVSAEDIASIQTEIALEREANEKWYRERNEAMAHLGINEELRERDPREYYRRWGEEIPKFVASNPPPWKPIVPLAST